MHEPKGRYLPLAGPRRFIGDLVHFARRIPSAPVSRSFDVSALAEPRMRHPARPSWSCLFMKAYALVGAEHAAVAAVVARVSLAAAVRASLDELCAGHRADLSGRRGGLRRASSAHRSSRRSTQLQQAVAWYKNETLEKVGFYRMALRFSQAPTPIRRLLWWSTLNVSGYKRCKRFGTFGLSSYGALGAEQLHPISPLTTTLTYGPIDPATRPGRRQADLRPSRARRCLHRAPAARHRGGHERADPGRAASTSAATTSGLPAAGRHSNVEPLLKPHLPLGTRIGRSRALRARRGELTPASSANPTRAGPLDQVTSPFRRPPGRS